MIAASKLAPSGTLKTSRIAGTSTSIPTRPYTTDGIPASRLTAVSIMVLTFLFATLERYTAVKKPLGTPMSIAPAVPYTLVKINGNIPYLGSGAVDAHSLPKRKLKSPISLIAGIPEIIKYTVMSRTQPTVIKPSMRNIPCMIFSNNLFFFILNLNRNKRRYSCTVA